jgi:hypothetical protein
MKKAPPMKRKPETHFEQVPVEVVKKIAELEGSKKKTSGTANLVFEQMTTKTEPYSMSHWWLVRTGS